MRKKLPSWKCSGEGCIVSSGGCWEIWDGGGFIGEGEEEDDCPLVKSGGLTLGSCSGGE